MTTFSFSRASARRFSAGVGLVTAIFLLVVLAGLGVAIVSVFTTQQQSVLLDVQGARAYQAARAGIEWGLFQQRRTGNCDSARGRFALPSTSSLSGFWVTVGCRDVGSGPLARSIIDAKACSPADADGNCTPTNNPDYVQRRLEVEL
jgi:MSHA biogenesis protein MshP